jgi:pyruvyltransferase
MIEETDGQRTIRLSWAKSGDHNPFSNLGDSLSPIMVAALSGCRIVNRPFDSPEERLCAVGTLGHHQRNGRIHYWGPAFDLSAGAKPFVRSPDTEYFVHALRGPLSRAVVTNAGIDAPEVYGDPVWFLPKIVKADEIEKKYDLGIILHISELTEQTPAGQAKPQFIRYDIDGFPGRAKVLGTFTDATWPAMQGLIHEMLACRRIVTTSFHGLVIPETYGIPCAHFALQGGGAQLVDPFDDGAPIEGRVRDYLRGQGRRSFLVYGQDRGERTDWQDVIDAIDRLWTPVEWDGQALFDAFPGPKAVNYDDETWPLSEGIVASITL